MIYFDNASTSFPKPPGVAQAVYNAINNFGSASRGAHDTSIMASRELFGARVKIAELVKCESPSQVAFTSNATESLNLVIGGLINKKSHVIVTVFEHNSVMRPLYKTGCEITVIGLNKDNRLDYDRLSLAIKHNTVAVICTHGSNVLGNLVNINIISKICQDNKILFVLDSAQTLGIEEINMADIDILCFTGHKSLFGPQGTGGIVLNKNIDIQQIKVGGSGSLSESMEHPKDMPERLEAGTHNCHSLAGLSKGIEFIKEIGIENIKKNEMELTKAFYEGVKNIKGIKIYGDFNAERLPIVSLSLWDYPSSAISEELWERHKIATRSGLHCAPLIHKAIGTYEKGLVRFSFSYFNTIDEVEIATKALKEIAEI